MRVNERRVFVKLSKKSQCFSHRMRRVSVEGSRVLLGSRLLGSRAAFAPGLTSSDWRRAEPRPPSCWVKDRLGAFGRGRGTGGMSGQAAWRRCPDYSELWPSARCSSSRTASGRERSPRWKPSAWSGGSTGEAACGAVASLGWPEQNGSKLISVIVSPSHWYTARSTVFLS